ncbi:methyltransferase [Paramuribaculum intestinale]|uniref:methyltransferase n=2 Tax=Muribaculaceae TaxID=2005473 RepID=UPI00258C4463|nr:MULTISPECIES: methyltransferase [Bacteroidales]
MTESKQNLIRHLRTTLVEVKGLPEMIEKEDLYLPDGVHVDTEFMMAMLQYVNNATDAAAAVMRSLQKLLGIDPDEIKADKKKNKEGKKWGVEDVLKHCTFNDNILRLPDVQLNPKSYAEVKKWITEAGGKWNGGKIQGFTFDFDATRVAGILMSGKRCNLKQEFQFFSTPPALAEWLVSLSDVKPGYAVLEPSAGTGAIIKAIHKTCPEVVVDAFELMPENRQTLEKMINVSLVDEDFTQGVPRLYDRIFANPPFARNQDIRHARMMYDALDPNGGEMCVITSRHWVNAPEKECEQFRNWLHEVNAETHEIPNGVFDESGTSVATMAIVIKRNKIA